MKKVMFAGAVFAAGLSVLFSGADARAAAAKKKVLMIAGRPSHGPGQHEHNAGVQLLTKSLQQGAGALVDVSFKLNGEWPSDEELGQADTILIYSDGGGSHPAVQGERLAQLAAQMKRGCGFVCLHYAVEPAYEKVGWPDPQTGPDGKPVKQDVPAVRGSKGRGAEEFKQWLGGYFEQYWSVNPHWTADFKSLPKHAVSNGVKPFSTNDEWYYHMRFRDGMKGVTPVLSDLPPESTTKRGVGPHAGNPDQARAVLELKQPQHVAWVVEREDGGRGFGFTGGHFHAGWANDDQRKLVCNAIVWTAKAEVPSEGVASSVTEADMQANLDSKGQPKK
jgi:type 1 glutamine amidotransferase